MASSSRLHLSSWLLRDSVRPYCAPCPMSPSSKFLFVNKHAGSDRLTQSSGRERKDVYSHAQRTSTRPPSDPWRAVRFEQGSCLSSTSVAPIRPRKGSEPGARSERARAHGTKKSAGLIQSNDVAQRHDYRIFRSPSPPMDMLLQQVCTYNLGNKSCRSPLVEGLVRLQVRRKRTSLRQR